MSDQPLIYVDLIKEVPLHQDSFAKLNELDETSEGFQDSYRAYRLAFQPWRLVVKSGGNQKVLFRSTERYFNEADARHAADIAFGPQSNVYLRQAEHRNVALRLAEG